jgi:hypothetical protein
MSFPEDGLPIDPGMHLTPGHFLVSPGLWLGLGVAAIFLAGRCACGGIVGRSDVSSSRCRFFLVQS